MSMPEHQHPIDPVSERLGELKVAVGALKERIDLTATKVEVVLILRLVGGLYALVVLGLTVLGWLITRGRPT